VDPLRKNPGPPPSPRRVVGHVDVKLRGRRTIAVTAWGTPDGSIDSISIVTGFRAQPSDPLTAQGSALTLPADVVPEVRAALAKLTRHTRR
jgi:hypothetical protein